jgi:hypothetical protein
MDARTHASANGYNRYSTRRQPAKSDARIRGLKSRLQHALRKYLHAQVERFLKKDSPQKNGGKGIATQGQGLHSLASAFFPRLLPTHLDHFSFFIFSFGST